MFISLLTTMVGILYVLGLSQGTQWIGTWPMISICALIAFGIQWIAFIPAYLKQTERFYDLTGSLTYIIGTIFSLSITDHLNPRALLLASFVLIWAVRLGSFLFRRVHQDGGDGRFDQIKPRFGAFLTAWTIQGLWVLITASAAWTSILSQQHPPLGWSDSIGIMLWVFGFSIEVIADYQKRIFRAQHGANHFIQQGLWQYSRHPNYFGEITLWLGIALMALPTLSAWLYLSLFSPIFVYLLITRVSGIPLLEERAQIRWGHDEEFQAYQARTSRLYLRKPRKNGKA